MQDLSSAGPGLGAFLAFFFLAVALWLLMRNMNARMRRMAYRERDRLAAREAARPQEPGNGARPQEPGSGGRSQEPGSADGSTPRAPGSTGPGAPPEDAQRAP